MIDVEVSEGEIRAVDVEKNEVTIQVDGWGPTATAPRLDRRVDEAISGETSRIELPKSSIQIESNGEPWTTFNRSPGEHQLPEGAHVIQVELYVRVLVAFSGSCTLHRPSVDEPIVLEFNDPTDVTIGLRSRTTRPYDKITVPRTLEGAVSAVRYQSSAIETDTPDRSYPSLRRYPALIEFGPRIDIPEVVYRQASFSGLTLTIPRSIGSLLVASPLIYYLKADVMLHDNGFVELDASTLEQPILLGNSAPLEVDIAEHLHRVFYLDCLVRNAGPYSLDLQESSSVNELDVDIDELYTASTAERVRAYFEVNYDDIKPGFPKWHLSTVVKPAIDNVRALPHLLDRMSLIQLPDPVPVDLPGLVADSINNMGVTRDSQHGSSETYELLRNKKRLGRIQGWLARGTPVDAFKTSHKAFMNRIEYHEQSNDFRKVLVIFNDDSMLDERIAVESVYRKRCEDLTMDVTVEESLDREQLADRLQSDIDFLHFVGHCDESGLRCMDGSLSVESLDETNVSTFFLNACRSFEQGQELIERGSIAGAVTLHDILNPQATKVGLTFAQLVMHGYNIAIALEMARKSSIMNKLYTVVGDGTYRLVQGDNFTPAINIISTAPGSKNNHIYESRTLTLSEPGGVFQPMANVEVPLKLNGNTASFEISSEELLANLKTYQEPVFYKGQYYWSSELRDVLAEEAAG